ncbi:MAG: M2 family metallopeptidase [Deltaproteobacteria bacterium]|nr:M2 family metallopeptidase [Deltaproteobacteria bacterium]
MPSSTPRALALLAAAAVLPAAACAHEAATRCPDPAPAAAPPAATAPTVADARAFLTRADGELRKLITDAERAGFVSQTYITHDTETISAAADSALMAWISAAVPLSRTFGGLALDAKEKRQLALLQSRIALPAPADPGLRDELATLASRLDGHYGAAKACRTVAGKEQCRDLDELTSALQDPKASWDELEAAWTGWHDTAAETKPLYARFVELANQGAREIGYGDLGESWRAGYDMPPAAFEAEVERLWQQVRPLYEKLHCYVRRQLTKRWGAVKVPPGAPIPAHLLGNMWAQDWSSLFPLVAPYPKHAPLDIAAALARKHVDAQGVVRYAEGFFVSLGLPKLPDTFWERSMFVKPRDREVVCHASAWDLTYRGDVRLKMCIQGSTDDFLTAHHELGHIYYYLAYKDAPTLFQDGANDGFHEAIGDAMALSVTPEYLVKVGLFDKAPGDEQAMLNEQMKRALEKVAFLPFGRLIDQWRFDVFSGKTTPADYNAAWWALKRQYQGVAPPEARPEGAFDPGAKYHVPGNTPYMRYFLAAILQFQIHRALCKAAGHEGPLYTCSIYGDVEAGKRLEALLEAGSSQPWQDSLAALTGGEREMDATAILDYFEPLSRWLDQQNEGQTCGW